MRILFFSDIHGDHGAISRISQQLPEMDAAFGLGDFASFGRGLEETLEKLDVGTDVYLLPGNHDDADELKLICKEHSHFIYFHGEYVIFESKTFAGLGGGKPGLPFSVSEEKVQQILNRFMSLENLVLVTHTPPYGTAVDMTWSGTHIGYHSLRDFITEVQPLAVYSGHVHEAEGKTDSLGTTQLFLVGPDGLVHNI
ncbi:MAG: metallophosphoesterase [Candidatus Odinarchaeota archaeon]